MIPTLMERLRGDHTQLTYLTPHAGQEDLYVQKKRLSTVSYPPYTHSTVGYSSYTQYCGLLFIHTVL